ncbi:hypothetical protein CHH52_07240 [Shouchella clausii]|nr:hypothetical protein CHH52_07240 [Shouchella clausii]
MSNRNNWQHWKLLIQILLGLTLFLFIGLLLVALFKWASSGRFSFHCLFQISSLICLWLY